MNTRVQRMDGVEETVTKDVEVSRLITPKMLTLTKMPAGQVAFKVVRDDNQQGATMTATPESKARRVRAVTRSSLLYVEFPTGTTMEEVNTAITEYGMDGYTILQEGDKITLMRSDLSAPPEDALTVLIGGGRRAGVVRNESSVTRNTTDPMPHIAVVAIDFNKSVFPDEASVMSYLQRHDIDFLEKGVENAETVISVARSEVEEGLEVRSIEVESGVVAKVTRSAIADAVAAVPFTEVVSETAYGSWGWGQLDFAASMADVEFCDQGREASDRLSSVIYQILFYSALPIATRKELVTRATSQFSDYITNLLDALPAKVILINRSNFEKSKEQQMTTKTPAAPANAAPAADDASIQRTEAAPAATASDDSTPVTRGELKALIGEAIANAMKPAPAADGAPVSRSDAGEAAPVAADGEGSAAITEMEKVITRSMAPVTDAVKGLSERLAAIEGATVVRSDAVDSGETKPAATDVFAGVLGINR